MRGRRAARCATPFWPKSTSWPVVGRSSVARSRSSVALAGAVVACQQQAGASGEDAEARQGPPLPIALAHVNAFKSVGHVREGQGAGDRQPFLSCFALLRKIQEAKLPSSATQHLGRRPGDVEGRQQLGRRGDGVVGTQHRALDGRRPPPPRGRPGGPPGCRPTQTLGRTQARAGASSPRGRGWDGGPLSWSRARRRDSPTSSPRPRPAPPPPGYAPRHSPSGPRVGGGGRPPGWGRLPAGAGVHQRGARRPGAR